jgi:hypothetical protein
MILFAPSWLPGQSITWQRDILETPETRTGEHRRTGCRLVIRPGTVNRFPDVRDPTHPSEGGILTTDDRPATDVATSQQVLKISELLAVAVYYLTEGMTSAAARVSRIALLPYLVFYSTYDSVVGLSTGLVVHYGAGLAPDEQAVLPGVTTVLTGSVDQPIPWVIVFIGSLSWAVAVIAAAVALSRAGASWAATVPLGLAGVIGAIDHALPFGPIAMALFLVAAYVLSRPGHETA